MDNAITILLATYNGSKYLAHQLDSLFNQTYKNWRLLIRDDGSTDNTLHIVEKYKNQYPDLITVIPKTENQIKGSVANFSALLQAATDTDYIMFCDQDDEWKPTKIETTFSRLKDLEAIHGKQHAVMVFTNFQYVDEEMKVIESKNDFQINTLADFGFAQLLAQNPVYGCTSIINRALADKVKSVPRQAENHDHWIALVAAAFGTLYYLNEKTVLYRQHGKNVSGSHDNDSFSKRIKRIFQQKKNYTDIIARREMICVFAKRYSDELAPDIRKKLDTFLRTYKHKSLLIKDIRNRVRCQTIPQTFLFYTTFLFSKFDDAALCESEPASHSFEATFK